LSVNFEEANYDFDNMKDTYSSDVNNPDYTDTERDAVATLMYHVGVACHMNYGPHSSAAHTELSFGYMNRFFKYIEGTVISPDNYPEVEYHSILQKELQNNRPIFYAGNNTAGIGHTFILDGYDIQQGTNYYHINYG